MGQGAGEAGRTADKYREVENMASQTMKETWVQISFLIRVRVI